MYSIASFGQNNFINLSLMCPYCFNITTNTYETDIYYEDRIEFDTHLISNHNRYKNGLRKKCSCSKCESSDPIILDGRIASVVSILNKKGYTTTFSCEGHNYGKFANSLPYICFDSTVVFPKLFEDHPLPDGWYVSVDADINIIQSLFKRSNIGIYFGEFSKSDEFNFIRFNNKELLKWAKSLPKNK